MIDIKSKITNYDKGIKLRWVKALMGQRDNKKAEKFAKHAKKILIVDFIFFDSKALFETNLKGKIYGYLSNTVGLTRLKIELRWKF